MPTPFDQSRYQVRLDWGAEGLARLAPADVVVVIDVLRSPSAADRDVPSDGAGSGATDAAADGVSAGAASGGAGADAARQGLVVSSDAAVVVERAADSGALVLLGGLRNAAAVARAIIAEQRRRGERTSIAIVAAGEPAAGGSLRFAVEDQFGAGAVIDALGEVGIDHTAPEAAAAAEAFRGLRRALRHLLTASGSGQALIEAGRRDEVLAAAELDADETAPVLRGVVTAS